MSHIKSFANVYILCFPSIFINSFINFFSWSGIQAIYVTLYFSYLTLISGIKITPSHSHFLGKNAVVTSKEFSSPHFVAVVTSIILSDYLLQVGEPLCWLPMFFSSNPLVASLALNLVWSSIYFSVKEHLQLTLFYPWLSTIRKPCPLSKL